MLRPSRITPAELPILQYITDHHPVTVGEVAEHFASAKRTTVLTLMERLRAKGHLTRKKIGGVYHYSPSVQKRELLQRLVREFVEKALGGSLAPFVAYITQRADLTDDELKQLKQLLREVDMRRKARNRESKTEN